MTSKQSRKATPSELWSTLPTPKSELLPQMKRDYQALSLAASLDPKRFMKGGTKPGKVPEVFAVGHPLLLRMRAELINRIDWCYG